jgi:CheY-like chemotaxis protein
VLYNILVVEDDRRMAQSLAAQIGVLGHTVAISYGPRMALQQLNEVIPDVIFMDVNMPGIDGLEVLRFLRRDPMTKDVPVIIVSAEEQEESKRVAIEAGANYYIVKPPTLEEIEKALDLVVHLASDSEEPDDQKGRAPDTRAAD